MLPCELDLNWISVCPKLTFVDSVFLCVGSSAQKPSARPKINVFTHRHRSTASICFFDRSIMGTFEVTARAGGLPHEDLISCLLNFIITSICIKYFTSQDSDILMFRQIL